MGLNQNLISVNLPLKNPLPFKGRVGVGMGSSGAKNTHPPQSLPLEGGGTEQRKTSAHQVTSTAVPPCPSHQGRGALVAGYSILISILILIDLDL
ncbi:MAG: hypothetical protein A2075_04295 [Geobacteraceae bacterium GWC2_58_44]|nr:MAG: hypothetical protein A2075_04295 [Geobacteraceae bacterium GWC2_58_44]